MSYNAETALDRFKELGQEYGGFISHADVEYIIQINEDLPKSGIEGAPLTEVLERRQWEVLGRFDSFKSMMLEDFNMLLVNVRGQGYRIASPSEHAELAARNFSDAVQKAGKQSMEILCNVNKELLTSKELSRHADVEVRLAGLSIHIKNNIPLADKYKPRSIG